MFSEIQKAMHENLYIKSKKNISKKLFGYLRRNKVERILSKKLNIKNLKRKIFNFKLCQINTDNFKK